MSNLPTSPKKHLGQHWLNDALALQAVVDAAELNRNDIVLEVGPGPGALTKLLVSQAKKVVAVEFDENWAKKLPKAINSPKLEVVTKDILKFNFAEVPPDYKLAANIPYYLTSHLFRVIYESFNPPTRAVVLVQKEVAERAVALPGNMNLLAISLQLKNNLELGRIVPAELFEPPPKVDSQILILRLRSKPLFDQLDEKLFFRLVKAGFSSKRKKLRSSLSAGLQISKSQATNLLNKAGIDENLRAQQLSLQDWYNLQKNYSSVQET